MRIKNRDGQFYIAGFDAFGAESRATYFRTLEDLPVFIMGAYELEHDGDGGYHAPACKGIDICVSCSRWCRYGLTEAKEAYVVS